MIFVACAAVICGISIFLIEHPDYEDGVCGRLALMVLALSNGLIVCEYIVDRDLWQLRPSTFITEIGMALFLGRHCYRFLMWRYGGKFGWTKHDAG